MIYVIIGIGVLLGIIGFVVTENNSKYLLSGYNTMSEDERQKVDLKAFIPFFKRFHILLGVSTLLIGLLLYYSFESRYAGLFLGVYPILAYLYFIWKSKDYHEEGLNTTQKFGMIVLLGTLVFVIWIFAAGFKESKFSYDEESINIEGMYGETIQVRDIESIELVNVLPSINSKTNGFSAGSVHKGYYKTDSGEKIKLILNSENPPYMFIKKNNGERIYFCPDEEGNEKLYNEMKDQFSSIIFK